MSARNYQWSICFWFILSTKAIQEHFFIEIDVYSEKRTFLLSDFPVSIKISETYVSF